jgi:hypothetical protein
MPFTSDESGEIDKSIAVRALIKNTETTYQFHSRTGAGEFVSAPTFGVQPEETEELAGQYVINHVDDDGTAVYDLFVKGLLGYFNPGEYNAYADYKFFYEGDADHPFTSKLIVKDESENSDYTRLKKLGADVPDVKLENGQNWSQYLMTISSTSANAFPVLLSEVAKVKKGEQLDQEKMVCYRVYAVYPFLYDPDTKTSLDNGNSGAPRREASESSNVEEFSFANRPNSAITTNRQSVLGYVDVKTNGPISGIEAVNSDTQDLYAPVEYYTISGVRVSNNPGPGIYIRRQGNTVTKVAIR